MDSHTAETSNNARPSANDFLGPSHTPRPRLGRTGNAGEGVHPPPNAERGIGPSEADKAPRRVTFESLAAVKRALAEIRAHADDRPLLLHVMRMLRDRAALEGAEAGFEDYRAGRIVPLGDDLKSEIAQLRKREPGRRSKSR